MRPNREIFDRTDGRCHICRKKLAFKNYGVIGKRGAREIDHSLARANGGSDHGNNLYAACISCNRSKQAQSSKSVRRVHGFSNAPLSRKRREAKSRSRQLTLGGIGLVVGFGTFGPFGALAGSLIGQHLGRRWKVTD